MFPRQRRIIPGLISYAGSFVSTEHRWLVISRDSCLSFMIRIDVRIFFGLLIAPKAIRKISFVYFDCSVTKIRSRKVNANLYVCKWKERNPNDRKPWVSGTQTAREDMTGDSDPTINKHTWRPNKHYVTGLARNNATVHTSRPVRKASAAAGTVIYRYTAVSSP
jgi:hypothetical protein